MLAGRSQRAAAPVQLAPAIVCWPLDAERGKPAAGFGDRTGRSISKPSIRGDVDGGFSLASPPSVYKNIVITGGNNGEQSPSSGLYGDIRGWDARTGKLLWSFHTVPRAGRARASRRGKATAGRTGQGPMSGRSSPSTPSAASSTRRSARRRRTTTAAIAKARICTATPSSRSTPRPATLKWHQQLVHHDIWDYDVPAAPTLVDVKRNGQHDAGSGCRHDEDGAGLHLRPRHRRADLRRRRAAGAAEQRARRERRGRRSRFR